MIYRVGGAWTINLIGGEKRGGGGKTSLLGKHGGASPVGDLVDEAEGQKQTHAKAKAPEPSKTGKKGRAARAIGSRRSARKKKRSISRAKAVNDSVELSPTTNGRRIQHPPASPAEKKKKGKNWQ